MKKVNKLKKEEDNLEHLVFGPYNSYEGEHWNDVKGRVRVKLPKVKIKKIDKKSFIRTAKKVRKILMEEEIRLNK